MTKRMKKTTKLSSSVLHAARPLSDDELALAIGGVKITSGSGAGLPHGKTEETSGSGSVAGRPPGWNASPNSRRKQLLSEI